MAMLLNQKFISFIFMPEIPQIPLAEWTDWLTKKITRTFSFIFDPLKDNFDPFMKWVAKLLIAVPPVVLIIVIAILAFFLTGRRIWLSIFTIVGLWLIHNQGYWDHLINTFTLVLISSLLSVVIGVPIGILMAKSKIAEAIITPILDFMQTMPAFVYLIPAVAFSESEWYRECLRH